jgi:hypothetical protein
MVEYGGGPSTGLDQTASGKIATGFGPDDVAMSGEDRAILRALAERVARIAASTLMAERRAAWRTHNALRGKRPLLFCDPENGWNEIITEAQMRCRGRLARRFEMDLRKEIFWGEEMGDDRSVEPSFIVPYTVTEDDWGLTTVYHKPAQHDGAQTWDAPIRNYETDLPKLHAAQFEIDWTTTRGCLEISKDVFGGILDVRLQGIWWWTLGVTNLAATLRGLNNLLMDFYDHPDELKELLQRISNGQRAKLDRLEREGLLSLNNDGTYVGSGGFGFTDELPAANFSGHVRCADMWGFAESQETVGVSPAMYEEFVFPAEQPTLERFGLNCYGCCEPLHKRWSIVKRHARLRRVSCSPWTDLSVMATELADRMILSWKPNPADLARPNMDEQQVRQVLRAGLEATRGCHVEIIMKDNHTLGGTPANATRWCAIAREEIARIYPA